MIVLFVQVPAHADAPSDLVESSPAAPSPAAPSLAVPAPEPPTTTPPRLFVYTRREVPPSPEVPLAIGLNNPVGWYRHALAASLYVGLSPHHAIRANFAYYKHEKMLEELANAFAGGEIPSYRGRLIDYGAGLVWYPRRRWEGFMLEAGALLRDRAIRTAYEEEVVKNWTTSLAGRGMLGWSWRIGPTFIAAAVGLSAGYEVGREAVSPDRFPPMPTIYSRISRVQVDGEAYLRLGLVFGG